MVIQKMISDDLLARDQLEFDEWATTPKPEHLVPDSIERERTREQFRADLRDDPDAVVVTHTDADGLSSAALIVAALERDYDATDIAVQPIDYHGAYRFEHVVGDLLDVGLTDTPIYVSDFALDNEGVVGDLERLTDAGCLTTWYDHHQWDDSLVADLEDAGVTLTIDEDECTASLLARELGPYDDHLEDLAECTKDIDLWIRDDPRSERLNVFASIVDSPWEYIDTVLVRGPDLPDDVERLIDERLERDRELEQYALENCTVTNVSGYSVAISYVRGGRSSQIGNDLVEELDHDIAVIMKPHGGIGIYSHSDRETFARCHEVADQLGGGGHPTAAGCEIPVESFSELAAYWTNEGSDVHEDIYQAIEAVVGE